MQYVYRKASCRKMMIFLCTNYFKLDGKKIYDKQETVNNSIHFLQIYVLALEIM